MNKTTWVEALRKRWHLWTGRAGDGSFTTCGAEVEEFISELLQLQRREIVEMIEGMKWDYNMIGGSKIYTQALDDIIKKVGE